MQHLNESTPHPLKITKQTQKHNERDTGFEIFFATYVYSDSCIKYLAVTTLTFTEIDFISKMSHLEYNTLK